MKNPLLIVLSIFLAALIMPRVFAQSAALTDLPQTPSVFRKTTDAQDNNLKGKVKYVLAESEELPAKGREKDEEVLYNEMGKRTARNSYLGTSLIERYVFGYIDGARVSKYQLDTTGDAADRTSVFRAVMPATKNKPDPRYSYKYVYEYDSAGRLSVEKWIDNRGEESFRKTYVLNGNVLKTYLAHQGKDTKDGFLEMLDKNGNILSSDSIKNDKVEKPDEKDTYIYEQFDTQGNWTRRKRTFIYRNEKGKLVTSRFLQYRKIEYYP